MIYTRYEKLNIIKLKTHMDTLPFDIICKALQMRPSNTIYCEADGKLYGIISSGDIDRAHSAKKIVFLLIKNLHPFCQINLWKQEKYL